MNIFKKMSELPEVMQNKKIIEQTKSKKEQLLKAINMDINSVNLQINVIFQEIGKKVYESYIDDDILQIDYSLIGEQIENIKLKKQEQENLSKKYKEIEQRYGEELEMLQKFIPQEAQTQTQNNDICPKCKAVKNTGDMFCTNCGNKY